MHQPVMLEEALEQLAIRADGIYLDTTDEMIAAARLYEQNGYEPCDRYNENPQATIFKKKNLMTGS